MISAKDPKGQPIDWWFIYKTPEHSGRTSNQGFDFFYYDAQSTALQLSPQNLKTDAQALSHTLDSIFSLSTEAGFLVYNDEHVDQQENKGEKGHCKGILAFDKSSNSAFLLLHSTPRFPALSESTLPIDEEIYGQTYLCITLADYASANQIAAQMLRQQNPQILDESSRLPDSIGQDEPLYQLYHGLGIDESHQPQTLELKSRAGKAFKLIAKSRHWGEDFWIDLISPELNADLIVETWRRGAVTAEADQRSSDFDEDALDLNFVVTSTLDYRWHYTKDHSKWATALENPLNPLPWVCVADINRMVSQEKRGGGALCFQEPALWLALKNAEAKIHQYAQNKNSEGT